MARIMESVGKRTFFMVILLSAHVQCSFKGFDIEIRESILVRAVARIIIDTHKRQLQTLHFIRCDPKHDDVLSEAVNSIGGNFPYTIESTNHLTALYPRWFNVIFIGGEKDHFKFVKKLNDENFDPRGYYIVVVDNVYNASGREDLSRTIFKSFFVLFYDDVVVLFRDEVGTKGLLYTFSPCSATHACYEVVPEFHNTFNGERFEQRVWHFAKKWKNFYGCPVVAAIADFPPFIKITHLGTEEPVIGGLDMILFSKMAAHFNFTTIVIISNEQGFIQKNGTASGSVNVLMTGNANLSLGGYGLTRYRMRHFTMSMNYVQTEFVYVLPISEERGPLERYLFPLKKDVWAAYFFIYILAFIFLTIIKKFASKLYNFAIGNHTRSPFFDMFQMFFGVSFHRTPKHTFARSLFGIWLLTNFILSSTYRGRLFEMLTARSPKKIPGTIKEFDSVNYDIHVRPELALYLASMHRNDSRVTVMTDRMLNYYLELQIPSGRQRAVMDMDIVAKYFNSHHYWDGVLPVLPERLQSVSVCLLFKKNSFFVKPFNNALQSFIHSGLLNKWIEEVVNISSLKSLGPMDEPKSLSLSHFEGAFELWAMVILCSIYMFVIELLSLRWKVLRRIVQFYTE